MTVIVAVQKPDLSYILRVTVMVLPDLIRVTVTVYASEVTFTVTNLEQ